MSVTSRASSRLESAIGTPPVPAPRHDGLFQGKKAPRRPSFNEGDVSDKPQFIKEQSEADAGVRSKRSTSGTRSGSRRCKRSMKVLLA